MDEVVAPNELPPQAPKRVRFACDLAEHDDVHQALNPDRMLVTAGIPTDEKGASSTKPNPDRGAEAVEPLHVERSTQIVPYVPRDAQLRGDPSMNLLPKPRALFASCVPRHVLVGDAGPLRDVEFPGRSEYQLGPNVSKGHARFSCPPLSNIGNEWVIVSAERVKEQAEKVKALEEKVNNHKRDRVLIYDAAMKQAEQRKEEGVNEAKNMFERVLDTMRREVDQELSKISDRYQECCRDYATMVSDECEGEVSKQATELRKDWARQKQTIDQLMRSDGHEDRQASVLARAVMEQLHSEKKAEMAALRADIYSDIKMEFESREVALREVLESDFQKDLDGQLLLAEIRHQKEIDQLRMQLGSSRVPSAGAATGAIVVQCAVTTYCEEKGGQHSTSSPHLSKHPLQGAAAHARERGGVAIPIGKPGRKFRLFKTPIQKVQNSRTEASMEAPRPANRSGRKLSPKPRIPVKKAAGIPKAFGQDSDLTTTPTRKQESEVDGITSALSVSPTKALSGVVTPSIASDGRGSGDGESSRPKKRAKRLFSTAVP